ncbi:hypothetical protein JCM11251_005406 [Rhodosporidiobolus azoricus]
MSSARQNVARLPLELVERILFFAFPDPAPGSVWMPRTPYRKRRQEAVAVACVCRAWKPFGTKLAWRNLGISLSVDEDVQHFQDIFMGKYPTMHVRTAVIHVVTTPPPSYPPQHIHNFLLACPNLETLALWNSSELVFKFLDIGSMSSRAQVTASNLKHLELRHAAQGGTGEWDPQHILRFALPSLPNLVSLNIAYACAGEPFPVIEGKRGEAKSVLPSLKHLELTSASDPPRFGERLTLKHISSYTSVHTLTSLNLFLFHAPSLDQLASLLPSSLLSLTMVVNETDACSYLSTLAHVFDSLDKLQHFRLETILSSRSSLYPSVPFDFADFLATLPLSLVSTHIDFMLSPAALIILTTAFLPSRLIDPFETWSCRATWTSEPGYTSSQVHRDEIAKFVKLPDGANALRWLRTQ